SAGLCPTSRRADGEKLTVFLLCEVTRLMWWTVPAPSDEVPYGDRCDRITSGSHRHASHHDRFGYRQERVPGPWHRRGREGRRSEATSAQPGVGVLQGAAAVPYRHGGVRQRPLLGAFLAK